MAITEDNARLPRRGGRHLALPDERPRRSETVADDSDDPVDALLVNRRRQLMAWSDARDDDVTSRPQATPDDVETDREFVERRRAGRATHTLQATWLDPEETPFTPAPRPGRAVPARLFSLLVTAMIVGLLAWLILPEVSLRLSNVRTVTVEDGVLTAQPVPLAPTDPSTVEELFVDATNPPDSVLPAGTPIARLRGSQLNSSGSVVDLTVPFDARLASVDTLEGAITLPGTPVATVYDPRKMSVIVTVAPSTLDVLRQGMRAELHSPLLATPVDGTVVSAIPLLGTDYDPTSTKLVNVRIKPDQERASDLVPGIRFDATIDLDSAPQGAGPLVFTSAGGPTERG